MDAILLVGGFGTRLLPLTRTLPKPLIPLANIPFIERTVCWLRDAGIDHVVMSLHYNAELFIDYFARRELGVKLTFAVEEQPLGTGGAIANCISHLTAEQCFIFNGDIFTNLNLSALYDQHTRVGAAITIALTEVDDPSRYGVIETDGTGRIRTFTEKPPRELARSRDINAGIYMMHRAILARFPAGPCSVERDIFPRLLHENVPLYGYRAGFYWTDLGTPEDYLQAHRDILARRVRIPLDSNERLPGVWIGDGVQIAGDALLRPPVLLGNGVHIGAGATVGPLTALGTGVQVGAQSMVVDSIVWEGAHILADSHLRGCVLGRETRVSGLLRDSLCCQSGMMIC